MNDDGHSAWITPKVQGKYKMSVYVSSYLFDKDYYMGYTELLNMFGFCVRIISKDN